MHAGHARNARDAFEQQFLESVHVGRDDLELVVGLLPGTPYRGRVLAMGVRKRPKDVGFRHGCP